MKYEYDEHSAALNLSCDDYGSFVCNASSDEGKAAHTLDLQSKTVLNFNHSKKYIFQLVQCK